MKIYCSSIAILLILALSGCKTQKTIPRPSVASAPENYSANGVDVSVTMADIKWHQFFDDSLLVNLIYTALENSPDMQMALQRVEAGRAGALVGRNLWLPSLSLVTTAGQRKFGEYTMDGIGNFDTNFSENLPDDKRVPEHLPDYFVGLQSTWEIDLWGRLRELKKAALARYLASEQGRHLVTTTLVSEIAKRYYELLALDAELQVISSNIALQQTAVSLMEIQKLAGRATELAVKQTKAQLFNTLSLQATLRQRIVAVENELNALMGRYPQPIPRGKPLLDRSVPVETNAGIPAQMLLRRPDIQQAELNLLAAEADLGAARAAFFPQLTIASSIGWQSFRASDLFNSPGSIAYSVLGGLTTPIFNRKMVTAEYKRTAAGRMEAFYAYHKTVLISFQEVETNLQRLENLAIAADFKRQETEVLKEGVANANDLYLAGLASYLEVITAQRSALDAELQLAETKKEQFFALIDLYRAVGGGWQ